MFEKPLAILRCPYCQKFFERENLSASNSQIFYAILSCECDSFPVLDGIVYLKKDEQLKNKKAVELLRNGQLNKAHNLLLEERKKIKWIYKALFLMRKNNFALKKVWVKYIFQLFSIIDNGSKDWYQYCYNRKNRIVFKICEATTSLVKKNTNVVDCATGIGHFLEVLNTIQSPNRNIGIDYSFKLLYLSRLFVADPQNLLICCDLNYSLPFEKHSIKTLFFNDCFMYIFNHREIFNYARESLRTDGELIINHIHLSNKFNLGEGYSISIPLLKEFTKKLNVYANTDQNFFQGLLKGEIFYNALERLVVNKKDRSLSVLIRFNSHSNSKTVSATVLPPDLTVVDYSEEQEFRFL